MEGRYYRMWWFAQNMGQTNVFNTIMIITLPAGITVREIKSLTGTFPTTPRITKLANGEVEIAARLSTIEAGRKAVLRLQWRVDDTCLTGQDFNVDATLYQEDVRGNTMCPVVAPAAQVGGGDGGGGSGSSSSRYCWYCSTSITTVVMVVVVVAAAAAVVVVVVIVVVVVVVVVIVVVVLVAAAAVI